VIGVRVAQKEVGDDRLLGLGPLPHQISSQVDEAGSRVQDQQPSSGPDFDARRVATVFECGRSWGGIGPPDASKANEQILLHEMPTLSFGSKKPGWTSRLLF